MNDVGLYPQRVYRNADPETALQLEKKKPLAACTSDADQVAKFKNKSEERALGSYCHGVDTSVR